MKTALTIIGILLILAGGVWFFQGINLIPGSVMTGQTSWAVYGVIAVLVGAGLLVYASRRGVTRR